MSKEKDMHKSLIEISALLYVLEIALDTDTQPAKNTSPYACFVKLIRNKIGDLF